MSEGSQPATSLAVKTAVALLHKETERVCRVGPAGNYATALSLRISLFAFICCVFSVCARVKGTASPVWGPLVQMTALSFDAVSGEEESQKRKPGSRNALVLARRTIRQVSSEECMRQSWSACGTDNPSSPLHRLTRPSRPSSIRSHLLRPLHRPSA